MVTTRSTRNRLETATTPPAKAPAASGGHGHSHDGVEVELAASSNNTVIFFVIVLISLQSATLGVVLEQFPWIQNNELYTFLVGIAAIGGTGLLAKEMFRYAGAKISYTAIFFTITTWSAAVDFILACSLLGKTEILKFYMVHGEEYFKTSWGFWALMWDGTGHYVLQLYLAWALLCNKSYHLPGFFWCGSIIQSLPVLLLGAAVGEYSDAIKPSTALNVPYVIVPIMILMQFLNTSGQSTAPKDSKVAGGERLASAVFFVFHAAAIVFTVFRTLVSMDSQEPACETYEKLYEPILMTEVADDAPKTVADTSYGFIKVQMLQYFFYFAPFHAWAAVAEGRTAITGIDARTTALKEWAVVFAGAYTQAMVCYIGTAVLQFKYTQEDEFLWGDYAIRTDQHIVFWYANGGLLFAAIFYALWIWDTSASAAASAAVERQKEE